MPNKSEIDDHQNAIDSAPNMVALILSSTTPICYRVPVPLHAQEGNT